MDGIAAFTPMAPRLLPQNLDQTLKATNRTYQQQNLQNRNNMRVKPGFRLTDVCGTNILIAEGKENIDFSNIISMNDSAKLLWESIQDRDFTVEDLTKILQDNYQLSDGSPLPVEQAKADAEALAKQWLQAGIVSE